MQQETKDFEWDKGVDIMRRKQKRMLKKVFALMAIAILIFLPIGNVLAAEQSLADVSLLRDVDLKANLTNNDVKAPGDYKLDLTLTGEGVLDVELLNPEKSVVFYNEDVAKQWNPAGKAHVKVDMLPISLGDIPAVVELLDTVTGTVTGTVNSVLGTVNELNTKIIGEVLPIVKINGLDALYGALDSLNNLDDAVINLTDYDEEVEVVKGTNGEIIVNYSDALGTRLESAIKEAVLPVLTSVLTAVNNLSIEVDLAQVGNLPIVGDLPILGGLLGAIGQLLDDVLGDTLDTILGEAGILNGVLDTLVSTVGGLVTDVTNLTLDLLDDLVILNVLGDTTVNVPLTVAKPSGLNGDYEIHGILANTSAVDLALLSKNDDFATINFNEPAAPTTPTTPTTPTLPGGENGGTKLPKTSAGILSYGLLGLGTLLAGVGTRFYARRK